MDERGMVATESVIAEIYYLAVNPHAIVVRSARDMVYE